MEPRVYARKPTDSDLVHAPLIASGEAEPRQLAALLRIEDMLIEQNNILKQILAASAPGKAKKAAPENSATDGA